MQQLHLIQLAYIQVLDDLLRVVALNMVPKQKLGILSSKCSIETNNTYGVSKAAGFLMLDSFAELIPSNFLWSNLQHMDMDNSLEIFGHLA